MTQEQVFVAMIVAAGVLMLGYLRGRKVNLALVKAISQELETALRPKDQTYTWLGGLLGFRAEYTGSPHAPRVEATLTLAPRHSLLYLPVARLVTGGDRLFVVSYPTKSIRDEAHVVAQAYRRRLGRLAGEERWHRETVDTGSARFEVLGPNPALVASLRDWIRSLPQAARLKHVALVPGAGTLYLYLAPAPGEVQTMVARALTWFAGQA
jgi:hypothetical protein